MRKILTFLALLACTGCGTRIVMVPDEVDTRGVLVGEICPLDGSFAPDGDPRINNTLFHGGLREGYLTIPLAPGEYNLELLNEMVVGTLYFSVYRNYPIDLDFTVESRRATSIGLVLIQPARPAAPPPGVVATGGVTPYNVITWDNTDEMALLLQDSHPQLYSSLRADQPVLSTSSRADPASLARARETIVKARLQHHIRQKRAPSEYVTGCAGAIGRVTNAGSNGEPSITVLPTSTLANLSACNAVGDRMACLISRNRYISVTGNKVTQEAVPSGITTNTLQAVSKDRLVLIDDAMNVYTSADNGSAWTKYSGAAFEKPLGLDGRADPKNRFGVHAGTSGFYIFGVELDAAHTRLLQGDYRTGALRNLNLPPQAAYFSTVRETRKGLFVAPSWTAFSKGKIQFLPTGSNMWEQRETPAAACFDIAFPDDSGANLQVLCSGDNNVWNSTDGGITWKRIFRSNSLFALP